MLNVNVFICVENNGGLTGRLKAFTGPFTPQGFTCSGVSHRYIVYRVVLKANKVGAVISYNFGPWKLSGQVVKVSLRASESLGFWPKAANYMLL
jgi:hypothetical protein